MRHWPPPANCSCQLSTLKFFKGHTFWRGAPGLCDQEADEKPLSRKSKQQHPDVDPFRGWWSSRNGICLSSWNISAAHSREWELCSTEIFKKEKMGDLHNLQPHENSRSDCVNEGLSSPAASWFWFWCCSSFWFEISVGPQNWKNCFTMFKKSDNCKLWIAGDFGLKQTDDGWVIALGNLWAVRRQQTSNENEPL